MSEPEIVAKSEPEIVTSTSSPQPTEKENVDPDLFCCVLQPSISDPDPDYLGIRRFLLHRKAISGSLRRWVSFSPVTCVDQWSILHRIFKWSLIFFLFSLSKDWRCNGKGYVAYRNYIRRPRNWESLLAPSPQSTPGNRFIWPLFCSTLKFMCLDMILISAWFTGSWISGRWNWMPSPNPLSLIYEADSWTSSKVNLMFFSFWYTISVRLGKEYILAS